MNTSEIKLRIIQEVDALSADRAEEFYGLMLNFLNGRQDSKEWAALSEAQRDALEQAIKEADAGSVHSHEIVISELRKKYSRG